MNQQYQTKLHLLGWVPTSNQFSNHSPSTLNAANSILSLPNISILSLTTNLSSPYKLGQFHWICLAIAYCLVKGYYWCLPRVQHIYWCLKSCSRKWRIIATDFDFSSKSGRSAVRKGRKYFPTSQSVWKADQERVKLPSKELFTFSLTWSSQENSIWTSALKEESGVGFHWGSGSSRVICNKNCRKNICIWFWQQFDSRVYHQRLALCDFRIWLDCS